jgi:GGDEF domain-containing protein
VLARGCEPGEQVARIGGDGFAAITSLSGSDSVRALCGRLTIALAEEGSR